MPKKIKDSKDRVNQIHKDINDAMKGKYFNSALDMLTEHEELLKSTNPQKHLILKARIYRKLKRDAEAHRCLNECEDLRRQTNPPEFGNLSHNDRNLRDFLSEKSAFYESTGAYSNAIEILVVMEGKNYANYKSLVSCLLQLNHYDEATLYFEKLQKHAEENHIHLPRHDHQILIKFIDCCKRNAWKNKDETHAWKEKAYAWIEAIPDYQKNQSLLKILAETCTFFKDLDKLNDVLSHFDSNNQASKLLFYAKYYAYKADYVRTRNLIMHAVKDNDGSWTNTIEKCAEDCQEILGYKKNDRDFIGFINKNYTYWCRQHSLFRVDGDSKDPDPLRQNKKFSYR